MSHGNTYIAQHGRVRQITLQTTDRQFLCQKTKNGIGYAHITFRILKINRVHLMGHCTRTDLTGLDFLFEILHRDIHPEIAVQVNNNGINTAHSIKDCTQPVVVRDLCCPLFTFQSKFLANKLISKLSPIILRISDMVSVLVTRSTTELCRDGRIFQGT